MRLLGIRFAVCLLIICLIVPTVCVNADDEVLSLYMSYNGNAYLGGEINLRITISKPTHALAGLEFILDYDEEHLSPKHIINTENGKEMDVLITSIPNKWEQMSYHSAEDGFYHFRFAMPDTQDYLLDSVGDLVLNIPFTVIEAGSFDFGIKNEDIIAVLADDNFTPMSGVGGTLPVVAYSEAQKLAIEFVNGDVAPENGLYYADIRATNLGDTDGIVALEFALDYDKTAFKPKFTKNNESQMDVFMNDMPNDAWEQMCSYDENSGRYTLRFAALHSESLTQAESLISGGSLLISVPFEIIATEGSIGSLSIPADSVIAIDGSNKILNGSGDTKSVAIEKGVSTFVPEQFGYTVKDNCLLYIPEETKVSDFLSKLGALYLIDKNGNRVVEGNVGTGHILTDGGNTQLTTVVRGDGNGDGVVNAVDYVLVKRTVLGTFEPNNAQFYALSVNNQNTITATDYVLIKRHCLGTYNLNEE